MLVYASILHLHGLIFDAHLHFQPCMWQARRGALGTTCIAIAWHSKLVDRSRPSRMTFLVFAAKREELPKDLAQALMELALWQ